MKINNLRKRIAESLIAAGAVMPASAFAAPLGENLIVNASFEQTDAAVTGPFDSIGVTDWISPPTVAMNNFSYAYSQNYTSAPPPDSGERYFWGRGTINQFIDVSGASGQISAGNATYNFASYFSSYRDDGDFSIVTARFFDLGGTELGLEELGGQLFVDFIFTDLDGLKEWDQDFIDGTLPVGTATVEIEVFPVANSGGADGYVDLIEFSIDGFQSGENLIANPSFENTIPDLTSDFGSIGVTDWGSGPPVETTNNLSYAYSQNYTGDAPPDSGARYFYGNGLVKQDIDVADGDTATAIATGTANYDLSAFFSSYQEQGDFSTISARFFDGQDDLLGETEIGGAEFVGNIPVNVDGFKAWQQDSAAGPIPSGTARVELAVNGTPAAGLGDGYVDLLEFSISEGQSVCGDFDGDGDVDSADRTIQTTNWTGALPPGEGTKTFAQGDCDADGDVDTADQNGLISNWTGAQQAGNLEEGDDVDLLYDPATGNVKLDSSDADSGVIISFVFGTDQNNLRTDEASMPFPDVGTNTDNTVFQIGQTDPLNTGSGPLTDLGNIFPAGMTSVAELAEYLRLAEYASDLGVGGEFDLVVVPEATTFILFGTGFFLIGSANRRRRRQLSSSS